jgi:hypothetical protein
MIDGSKGGLSVNLGIDPSISDAIFGIVVYGAAVISIFYFLVPYQWYLRIFKGKVFANNYQQYINRINHYLDDAQSAIHYLKQRVNHKKNIEDHELILARLKEFKIHLNEHQPVTKQAFYQYSQQIYQAFFQYKNKSKAMLYQANNENEWTIK